MGGTVLIAAVCMCVRGGSVCVCGCDCVGVTV